ncbi:MAG: hypothetical protein NXH75_14920 [Halobacteriovoraceae bacterium]|nr:hypothetical protein [Halobacteriovoraceae bacterium]
MKTQSYLTICLTLATLLLSPLAAGNDGEVELFRIWTAYSNGKVMKSNYDIEEYICVTALSDEMMIQLFKQADNDWNKYETLRRKWARARFDNGLRQFAYVQALQDYATSPLTTREGGRKTFKITENKYFDRVQEMETQTLDQWLGGRAGGSLGIVKARKLFGQELKKIGYPHKEGISDDDLYWEWYELQKQRIKENFRLQEVPKTEYIGAMGYKRELHVRPTDMWDFGKEVSAKIESKLSNKRITSVEMTKVVQEDKRLPVLIKDIKLLGPDSTPLNELQKSAPAVFEDFAKNLEENVLKAPEGELTESILRYDSIVGKLVSKYETAEKLRELSKEMNQQFVMGQGDFNHFMMARLYEMGAIQVEQGANFKSNSVAAHQKKLDYATSIQLEASSIISNVIDDPSISKTMRLEDFFINQINKQPSQDLEEKANALKEDDYLKEFKAMANWVIKFQIKKASLNTIPQSTVELWNIREWEGQDRINKYLKAKEFTDLLDNFRRTKLSRHGNYATIRPDMEKRLEYGDAWPYVLQKFSK